MAKISVGVLRKQLVVHRQTLCQKTASFLTTGRRGRSGPYIDFADGVHFDNCESYGLYKQGMRLRVYCDVVMKAGTS